MTEIALEKLEKLSCPSPGEALHVYHGRLCEGLHTENLTRQPPALTQVPACFQPGWQIRICIVKLV